MACSCVSGCSCVNDKPTPGTMHLSPGAFPNFRMGTGDKATMQTRLPSILVSMWLDFAGFLQCRTEEEEEVMVGVNYIVVQ